ncbi:hypothetical protein LX16_0710 [Stackebrandtia albiflava]|uniref:Uncharacterized protein n=1 Tax=Stackebrandtia albiflava TaxID=406432 RepID=A0A562VAX5_9ACTN|nr:DUF6368 family protein [Stackebrandtia albiflava]TWJ15013.1 hypothetical protein LX16_0710 [Stackebrandtia albiflava]
MAGPVLSIELAETMPDRDVDRLRAVLRGRAHRFAERRLGDFALVLLPADSGVDGTGDMDEGRPFDVHLMGAGIGDEELFHAEHDVGLDWVTHIGFVPVNAVNVSAACNSRVDHVLNALLTAAIMDVIGGVAYAELLDAQVPIVAGLPEAPVVVTESDSAVALGGAGFLRAWAAHPGFRLLK